MSWPNHTAYTEAVRDYPHISLQDPKLKGGKPKRGQDGFLTSYSGGFSIVFPIVKGSNTFALRCWMEDVGNAEVRYKETSAYLQHVRLPYFVDFEYVPEGILVNGARHPITRMQWADGVSLRDFISGNLKCPRLFKVVADAFQKMVATLHKHQIAHGDLQDGNILLNRNRNTVEIKLIDYDSLFVPALRGQLDKIRGLPEYQHPVRMAADERTQATEKVDYFSEIVIYLSFLALSEKPELWRQFKDKTERGLLFSEKDFENPSQSAIFRELANLSPYVQQLALTLKDFCTKTAIDQLEPLEAILPRSDANSHSNHGFLYLNNNEYQEALTEFQKAIALDSRYERAQFGLGHVYLRTKSYPSAIHAFQQAIQQNPNYKEAHHGLSLAYFREGDNSRATTAANAALGIDPHYQPPRELLNAIKSSSSTTSSTRSSSTQSKQTARPRSTVSTPQSSSTTSKRVSTNPTSRSTISQSARTKSRSAVSTPRSSTMSRRHSTTHSSRSRTSQVARTNPLTNIWQYITDALGNNRHAVVTGVLGLALVVCLAALLTRGDTGGEIRSQNAKLKRQLTEKETEIQGLTSSILALEDDKDELVLEKNKLQDDLEYLRSLSDEKYRDVTDLRGQLTEQEENRQHLQDQLDKKNGEIRQLQNDNADAIKENQELRRQLAQRQAQVTDRDTILQQLRNEKANALEENQTLKNQLTRKTSEAGNLTKRVQELHNEAVKTRRQIQQFQNKNSDLTRQNQKLRTEIRALRNQPTRPQQDGPKINPEPPKKIQNYRNVVPRAASSNNQGVIAFDRGDYNKAISHFTTAIKADSKFVTAHYNLGCTYFQMEKYHNAIRVFNKVIVLNQKFEEAYYNRSLAYFKTREFQKAKQDATNAININPNYQRALELWKAIEKLH